MRFVSIDELADRAEASAHPRYLAGPYFPIGGLTVVHARPGVGKSTLLAGLAADAVRRQPWGTVDLAAHPFGVGIIDYENGASLTERIRAAAARDDGDDDVSLVSIADDPQPATDPDYWLSALEDVFAVDAELGRGENVTHWDDAKQKFVGTSEIDRYYPLLIVDPLRAVVSGEEKETAPITRILEGLRRLAAIDPPMVVIVAAHTLRGTKRPFGGDPIQSVPDQILYLPGETGPPATLVMQKNRHGPLAPDLPLTFTTSGGVPILLPAAVAAATNDEVAEVGQVVMANGSAVSTVAADAWNALVEYTAPGEWVSTKEWAEVAGAHRQTIADVYDELVACNLVKRRRRHGRGGGYEWAPELATGHELQVREPAEPAEPAIGDEVTPE